MVICEVVGEGFTEVSVYLVCCATGCVKRWYVGRDEGVWYLLDRVD